MATSSNITKKSVKFAETEDDENQRKEQEKEGKRERWRRGVLHIMCRIQQDLRENIYYFENSAVGIIYNDSFSFFRGLTNKPTELFIIPEIDSSYESYNNSGINATRQDLNQVIEDQYTSASDLYRKSNPIPAGHRYNMEEGDCVISIHFPSLLEELFEGMCASRYSQKLGAGEIELSQILTSQILSLWYNDKEKDTESGSGRTFPGQGYFESYLSGLYKTEAKAQFLHIAQEIKRDTRLFIVIYGINEYPQESKAKELVTVLWDLVKNVNKSHREGSEKAPYLKVLFAGSDQVLGWKHGWQSELGHLVTIV